MAVAAGALEEGADLAVDFSALKDGRAALGAGWESGERSGQFEDTGGEEQGGTLVLCLEGWSAQTAIITT